MRVQQDQYKAMLKMFVEAREVAKLLKCTSEGEGGTGGVMDLHWDL